MAMEMLRRFPIIFGFLILGTPVGAASQELGPPPIRPGSWAGLETPSEEKEHKLQQLLSTGLGAINPQSREDSRLFFTTYYLAADSPIDWTGQRATCEAGGTASSFRDAVQMRLNYFRAMAGVPPNVTFANAYNGKAQEAALMMSVNGQLSHYPPTTWTCYTTDGAEAAGNSNLCLGQYGRKAIDGYIQDSGTGNGVVGHRR